MRIHRATGETDPEVDAYKHQVEQYWKWSQFYHDAEIKVNAGAVAISSLAPFTGLGDRRALIVKLFSLEVNLAGIVIIVASVAAILSTLGYWRYYEYCDIYAKEFRKRYISKSVLAAVKEKADSKFNSAYPVLGRVSLLPSLHMGCNPIAGACFGLYIAFKFAAATRRRPLAQQPRGTRSRRPSRSSR